jgi:hypothetical protein
MELQWKQKSVPHSRKRCPALSRSDKLQREHL